MWGKKKSKTNQVQQSGQVNQTVQRRSTVGDLSSYEYSSTTTRTTTMYHSSETVRTGSQSQIRNTIFTNPISSTSLVPLSSSSDRRLSIDARPFAPTSIISNYKSPFQRNGLYNNTFISSTRSPLTPPATPSSTNSATSGINQNVAAISAGPSTNSSKVVPKYNTSGNNRGNVLIINNMNFMDNNEERKGAESDEKNVYELFKEMGFTVHKHRNLKLDTMKSKIESFRKSRALANGDISIVIIMSHGTNKDNNNIPVSGSFTQIISADGKCLNTEDVVAEFSAEKCPGMKGKPKIFIFQCCRGDENELQIDCIPRKKNVIKEHADMLIAFSTLPNFYSLRDTQKGSWYIQCICEVFKKHAKDVDVEHLLKLVDTELSNMHHSLVQTSTYESRGFNKQCFLNPKK